MGLQKITKISADILNHNLLYLETWEHWDLDKVRPALALIPELVEIGKPELSQLFSEHRIPSILEVLELIKMKKGTLGKFGFSMSTQKKKTKK